MRTVLLCATLTAAVVVRAEVRRVLEPLKPGEIVAQGWLKGQLELSLAGMGGHLGEIEPDQMEKPYVTREFDPANGARGVVGWCAEMGGEYAFGTALLAYALDDPALVAKAAARVRAAMALQEPDGYLGAYRPGDNRQEDYNAWGCHWFYNAMLLEYSRTGDKTILDAVHRGLLWFAENWSGEKKTDYAGPTIIEPASVVYKLTGDRRLLTFCEDYAAWLDRPGHKNGATFTAFPLKRGGYHVAAIAARLKVPAALAYASGKRAFLDAALKSHGDFHDGVGWQATYAPCADGEWVAAPSCVGETEYCDFIFYQQLFAWFASLTGDVGFADATERLVFNAAQGARAKDERTIGYMTSPNQWHATLDSSRWGPEPFYHVYAPNMNAACCPANSISLYPFYVLNAVSHEGRDLRIMNYGPYDVRTEIDGADVRVSSETDYPFDGRVTLRVKAKGWKGALRFRRPAWAESVTVMRNTGRVALPRDRLITIPGPWGADEEIVTVDFGWQPKVRVVRDRDFDKEPLKTVEWGALVFAQPVVEKWSRVERPKPGWGKDSAPPQPKDWPWLAINCEKEPVAYALPQDLTPADIRVQRTGAAVLPWQKPPVKLVVPMLRASSAYPAANRREPGVGSKYKGTHTPLPSAGLVAPDPGATREPVELVPFGATCLRTTCFPTAHAGERLSVLSWNTEHYGWERRSAAERTLLESNMFAVVRAVQPDIFLMQETYGSFERFKAALTGYDARLLGRCNAIFSRFPIVGTHEPYREKGNYGEPQGGAFNTQVADLDAGCMRLRACPVAMFWLPLCVRTPADKTPDELLAWENERQPYEAVPRPQAIAGILAGMAPFLAERDEVPILMAGDFNSHSHLDWTAATGDWYGHQGRCVPWPVSSQMAAAGFRDVFRTLYPDPAANYGATFPMPGVMDQHPKPFLRLDYVYAAGKRLKPVSFEVIAGDYHRPFVWHGRSFSAFPSDHAAVLVHFAVDTYGKRLRRGLTR